MGVVRGRTLTRRQVGHDLATLGTARLGDAPDTNHLKDGLKLNLIDAAGNGGDENEYRCEPGHDSRNESLCAALAFITVSVMDEHSAMDEHGLDVIIDTQ
jgi:hypothetical protein